MNLPRRVLDIEVPSPHPLPEATRRLQALHTRGSGLLVDRRNILARVTPSDTQARVYLHRDAGRNLIAEIHGDLKTTQSGSVLVGTASVHAITWFLPIAVMCFLPIPLGVFVFLGGPEGPPPFLLLGVPFALLGIGLLYRQATQNRAHLLRVLTKALA